jgi:enoyl-CoA hydratase/carnithine racemase
VETGYALVDVKVADNVGEITLNNPAKHNALSTALIDELCAAL